MLLRNKKSVEFQPKNLQRKVKALTNRNQNIMKENNTLKLI